MSDNLIFIRYRSESPHSERCVLPERIDATPHASRGNAGRGRKTQFPMNTVCHWLTATQNSSGGSVASSGLIASPSQNTGNTCLSNCGSVSRINLTAAILQSEHPSAYNSFQSDQHERGIAAGDQKCNAVKTFALVHNLFFTSQSPGYE